MHSLNLIAATGLLAANAVQAAPRALSFDASDANKYEVTHAYAVDEKDSFSEILPRGMEQEPTDCPAPVLIVTTTTVDVTVYVTPEPTPEPSPKDMTTPMATDTPRITISIHNMTVPEPCDDETTATQTSTEPHSSTASMTMSASSSSSSSAMSSSSSASTSSTPSRVTISIIPEHKTTPAPPSETETTPLCDEGSTFSYFTTSTTTAAPAKSSDDCVIDTAVTPVSTSTMPATATTSAPAQPTQTQCVHDEPTGKPTDKTMYCGIHGKPAGTYFIAEFIENKPDEPVTAEGCYQFCDSVMESTKGCQSYRFYRNNLGAPRCSLYGRNVAASVDDLDKNQPDTWYDLACGSPTAEKWHSNMPANHGKRSTKARV